MSKYDKILSSAVIGAIVIAATFLIFFLTRTQKTSLDGAALLFVLISEIILFGGIIFILCDRSRSDKTVIKIGMVSALSIYFIAAVLTAFLRRGFKENLNGFILANALFIMFTAVVFILLAVVSFKISSSNQKIKNARLNMDNLEKQVYGLMVDKKNSAYERPLNQIYEAVKFTDKTSAAIVDGKLNDSIGALDDLLKNQDENINDKFDEIISLLKQRNMELQKEKRGRF